MLGAALLSFGGVSALAAPDTNSSQKISSPPVQTVKPQVTTTTETKTEAIPYTSSTVKDSTLAHGTRKVRTAGLKGTRTITYKVTLIGGIESKREKISETITTPPTNEVIAEGTYTPPPQPQPQTQPSCPNGTYVNTGGATVCRPYESSGVPAGASARCKDGTYSFSQSRRGTCSGHGGVAVWL